MSKDRAIERLPSSLGYPFSTAVRNGDVWHLSGQVGLDPGTGKMVPGGIEAETRQTLENIKAVLAQVSSSMDSVLTVMVFLKDIKEFDAMNAVYADYFSKDAYPSRSAVAVAGLALDARVEIECTARIEQK